MPHPLGTMPFPDHFLPNFLPHYCSRWPYYSVLLKPALWLHCCGTFQTLIGEPLRELHLEPLFCSSLYLACQVHIFYSLLFYMGSQFSHWLASGFVVYFSTPRCLGVPWFQVIILRITFVWHHDEMTKSTTPRWMGWLNNIITTFGRPLSTSTLGGEICWLATALLCVLAEHITILKSMDSHHTL